MKKTLTKSLLTYSEYLREFSSYTIDDICRSSSVLLRAGFKSHEQLLGADELMLFSILGLTNTDVKFWLSLAKAIQTING